MIETVDNIKFFKTKMSDTTAQTAILNDVANGFEGNFQTIAKGWKKEDFHALYNSVINEFKAEQNLNGNTETHLSWVNIVKPYLEIPNHFQDVKSEGTSYTLRHYIKITNDQLRTHYVINDNEIYLTDIEENSIVIHPSTVVQGLKQNVSDQPVVIFTLTFSIKE